MFNPKIMYRYVRIWCIAQRRKKGDDGELKPLLFGLGTREQCVQRWNIIMQMGPKQWNTLFWQRMQYLTSYKGTAVVCYGKYHRPSAALKVLPILRDLYPGCMVEDWT
jgi:hypothetical protein